MKKKILIFLSIFILASLTGWLIAKYYIFKEEKKDNYLIELKDHKDIAKTDSEQKRIKIFLPSEDNIIEEDASVPQRDIPVVYLEIVLDEYLKRLRDGLKNTKLLRVFMDRNNTVYLDFSEGFRNDFFGDTKKERLFLKSIYRTVTENISDVEDVRILINGKEIDTAGGHIFILYGLREAIGIDE